MALGTDPIQAAFQLLALGDADGPTAEEREQLAQLKALLRQAREIGTAGGWADWYRQALELAKTLGARWMARRHGAAGADAGPTSTNPTLIARLKEAPTSFAQRWSMRLQDQAHQVRDELCGALVRVPVQEEESGIQVVFQIPEAARREFGEYVTRTLNSWASDVASNLTPSWHEWVLAIVAEERAAGASGPPPSWAHAHLATSAQLAPHVEASAARRVTAFAAFQRGLMMGRGLIMPIVPATGLVGGAVLGHLIGKESQLSFTVVGAGVGFVLLVAVVVPFAYIYGRSTLSDEREQARRDHLQRQRAALSAWVASTVEAHRSRMASALSGTATEMKARMQHWIDANYDAPKRPAFSSSDPERDSIVPLISSLNMARNAIAARLVQLDVSG